MERMWGGRRLESEFGKKLPPRRPIGESWEIVDRPEAQSVVRNGPLRGKTLHELWTQYREEIFGDVPDSPRFPAVLKLLDAHEKLSLQVHPPAKFAERLGGEPKTEFWYVAAADPGAEIYLGFGESITRDQFEQGAPRWYGSRSRLQNPRQNRATPPSFRQVVFMLWARVICSSKSSRIATPPIAYSIGTAWTTRASSVELHIDQALQCIDFSDVRPRLVQPEGELLLRHNLFEIRKWDLHSPREIASRGEFAIACCLTGSARCAGVGLGPGEFFLIPASLRDRQLKPIRNGTSLLLITIPKL